MLAAFPANDLSDLNIDIWVKNDSENLPLSITSNYEFVEDGRIKQYFLAKEAFIQRNGYLLGSINYFLSKHSHLYTFAKNTMIRIKFKPSKVHTIGMDANLNHNFEITKKLILKMNELSRQHNSKFVIVVIPPVEQEYEYSWEKYRRFYPDSASRTMPEDIFKTFCAENNLACIDLLPDFIERNFTNNDIDFKHDGHWNVFGNRLAAELLASKLRNLLQNESK